MNRILDFLSGSAGLPMVTTLLLFTLAAAVPDLTERLSAKRKPRADRLAWDFKSFLFIMIVIGVSFLALVHAAKFRHLFAPLLLLAFAAFWGLEKTLSQEIRQRGSRQAEALTDAMQAEAAALAGARTALAAKQQTFYELNTRYDVVRHFGNSLKFSDAWPLIEEAAFKLLGARVQLWLPPISKALPSGIVPSDPGGAGDGGKDGVDTFPDADWRAAASGRRIERVRDDRSRALWLPLAVGAAQPAILHITIPPKNLDDHRVNTGDAANLADATGDAAEILAVQVALLIEKIRLYQEVEHASRTDLLTGLLHHSSFKANLEEEAERAQKTNRPLALLMIDLDRFKSVNDTYGHRVGDQVLVQVARRLRETLRVSDIVARYGGEEFALLLPATGAEGAHEIAERLRILIEATPIIAHTEIEEYALSRTVSIGVAVLPDVATNGATLVERADAALYLAKKNGRNRVEVA